MARRRELECEVHLVPMEPWAGCPYCLRFIESAPDPADMSQAQRLEELERWLLSESSLPPHVLRRRIELLVGRPVAEYELADPDLLMRRAQRPRRQWDDW